MSGVRSQFIELVSLSSWRGALMAKTCSKEGHEYDLNDRKLVNNSSIRFVVDCRKLTKAMMRQQSQKGHLQQQQQHSGLSVLTMEISVGGGCNICTAVSR